MLAAAKLHGPNIGLGLESLVSFNITVLDHTTLGKKRRVLHNSIGAATRSAGILSQRLTTLTTTY